MNNFDIADKIFTEVTIPLDTARIDEAFNFSGWYFRIVDSSNSGQTVTIKINEPDANGLTMKQGLGWSHMPFQRLYLSHAAVAGGWIKIAYAGNLKTYRPELFKKFEAVGNMSITNQPTVDVATLPNVTVGNWPAVQPELATMTSGKPTNTDAAMAQVSKRVETIEKDVREIRAFLMAGNYNQRHEQ